SFHQVSNKATRILRHLKILHALDFNYLATREIHDPHAVLRHLFRFLFIFLGLIQFRFRRFSSKNDKARIGGEERAQQTGLTSLKFSGVGSWIIRRWYRRTISSRSTPFSSSDNVADDDFTIAIFGSVGIANKLAVT